MAEGERCPACGAEDTGEAVCPSCGLTLRDTGREPRGRVDIAGAAPALRPPDVLSSVSDEQSREPPPPGTPEYGLTAGYLMAGFSLVLPVLMLLAWMFAAIVIYHGRVRSGFLLILASTVLAGLGSVFWSVLLS